MLKSLSNSVLNSRIEALFTLIFRTVIHMYVYSLIRTRKEHQNYPNLVVALIENEIIAVLGQL